MVHVQGDGRGSLMYIYAHVKYTRTECFPLNKVRASKPLKKCVQTALLCHLREFMTLHPRHRAM